jgi:hypothetical protein
MNIHADSASTSGDIGWKGRWLHFPRSRALAVLWTLGGFLLVLTLGLAYVISKLSDETFDALMSRHYTSNGTLIEHETSGRLIEFWTPSEMTWKFLKKGLDHKILQTEMWMLVNDDRNPEAFAEVVKTLPHVLGYRRYEVSGGKDFRSGSWWVVTVTDKCETSEIVQAYSKYWYRSTVVTPPPVYIEEQHSRRGLF